MSDNYSQRWKSKRLEAEKRNPFLSKIVQQLITHVFPNFLKDVQNIIFARYSADDVVDTEKEPHILISTQTDGHPSSVLKENEIMVVFINPSDDHQDVIDLNKNNLRILDVAHPEDQTDLIVWFMLSHPAYALYSIAMSPIELFIPSVSDFGKTFQNLGPVTLAKIARALTDGARNFELRARSDFLGTGIKPPHSE